MVNLNINTPVKAGIEILAEVFEVRHLRMKAQPFFLILNSPAPSLFSSFVQNKSLILLLFEISFLHTRFLV